MNQIKNKDMAKQKKNKITKKGVQELGNSLMSDAKKGILKVDSFYHRLQNILLGYDNCHYSADGNCMIELRGGKSVFLISDFKFWK